MTTNHKHNFFINDITITTYFSLFIYKTNTEREQAIQESKRREEVEEEGGIKGSKQTIVFDFASLLRVRKKIEKPIKSRKLKKKTKS
jgi:hypothetical protein